MRKVILFLSFILFICVGIAHAQAVFKKYGFKKAPLTLSKGKYNEFFTNDEVVQIGTVRFNTRTNKIIEFLEEDTTKNNYLSDRSSIWYSVDPLAEKYPNYSPYVYCANNPVKFIDPDGRIIRNASNNTVRFQAVGKYGYNNNEVVFSGDGETNAVQVRGTIGKIYANDGKTSLTVLKVEEKYAQSNVTDKWGWQTMSKPDLCTSGTNCLGTVLLDNLYLPLNQDEVHNFLIADGYKLMKAKDSKFKLADIISFGGNHFIRAIGKSKNGELIWESRMAGDYRKTGNLQDILDYNSETFGAYNDTSNATLYRPKEGDKYVETGGNVIKQDQNKKVWINKTCENE